MNTNHINSLFSILIDLLSDQDANVTHLVVQAHDRFKATVLFNLPALTIQEQRITKEKRVKTIIAYRDRTKCSLRDAKAKIEEYLDDHRRLTRDSGEVDP